MTAAALLDAVADDGQGLREVGDLGAGDVRLVEGRQVTLGDTTYPLPEPFLVLATQNPIEQEGTYPLPEAQVDRFMLKLKLDYPTPQEEREILDRMSEVTPELVRSVAQEYLRPSNRTVVFLEPGAAEGGQP